MPAPHVAFVFLDGVGLGPAGPQNPLATAPWPALARLAGGQPWTDALRPVTAPGHVVRALDATLGLDGLPQSGTGQVALFSGVNAPALAGRHWGPYPHSATREAFRARSLWRRLLDAGVDADDLAFANAFPPPFFARAVARDRLSASSRMAVDAGVRLRTLDDLRAGDALPADLTGEGFRARLGLDVPVRPPEATGAALHALARRHRATLFEVYHTDEIGHAQDAPRAEAFLARLDAFVGGYLAAFDPSRDLLVVSSDHGNLDDLSVRTHTRRPVPLVALGRGADAFAEAASLLDVTPALVRAALA